MTLIFINTFIKHPSIYSYRGIRHTSIGGRVGVGVGALMASIEVV